MNSNGHIRRTALGMEVTGETPRLLSLHREHIILLVERGPAWDRSSKLRFRASMKPNYGSLRTDAKSSKMSQPIHAARSQIPFGLAYTLLS